MTNLEINTLAKNAEFRKIVESSIVKAATLISGEDSTALTDSEASKRHDKATSVLNNSQSQLMGFSYAAAAQSGLNTVITIEDDQSLTYTGTGTLDSDIDFTIASIWDDMSGVSFADKQPIV